MTLREKNLAVFRRRPAPGVFFQPRFEPWFDWHRQFGTLPSKLAGKSVLEAYDLAGASLRYVHYYTGQPNPVVRVLSDRVAVEERVDGDRKTVRYRTPKGDLVEELHMTVDRVWRLTGFAVRRPEDLPALRWMVGEMEYRFDPGRFAAGAAFVGDRGEPSFWIPKSPYFAMAQQWMRYEDFVYALCDRPADIEDLFRAIDASYEPLYRGLAGPGGPRIVNFGENVAMAYLSMPWFEEHVLPWYEKRSGALRRAGIFTHIHIDGYFRQLLPRLAALPFDGLEALTPEPQGDVTIDEMADAMGDRILLDGIPAVLFLDHHPREQLVACVERLVHRFGQRLVLGISDELPEGGGDEAFERLLLVARYCAGRGWA
jgi:hypothetical protein